MKFDVLERDIESSASLSTKKITLSANAKAFKIIFGQIYPDIIKAIVRELFTNAWDSQKVAETLETAIEIHLPTKWEPYFSIRDFGTGMTPQIIDDIYSKVFESSKDDSNEEAGMFGMGSKTPLGYTDAFAIMSYVNGTYYAYDIYIGKGGDPVIDLKATGECDEPNGVEVSLGVREEDFEQFKNYAEHFAINAGTPININRTKVLNTRTTLYKGEGWEMFDDQQSMYIRMGCVLYNLDSSMITRNESWSTVQAWQRKLNLPIILDFPIGTFDVTGSREDIIYNNESIAKIRNHIDHVISEIGKIFQDRMNKVNCLEEAYQIHAEIANKFYQIHGIIDGVRYKNWNRHKWDNLLEAKRLRLENKINFNPSNVTGWGDGVGKFRSRDLYLSELYDKRKKVTYVVIDPYERGGKVRLRLRNLIDQIQKYHSRIHHNIVWIRANYNDNFARLMTVLPKNHVWIHIDDIEPAKVERVAREREDDTSFRLREAEDEPIRLTSSHYTVEEGSYFVRITKRKFDDDPQKIADAARILQLGFNQVHAIPKTSEYMIEEYDLIDLLEAAEEYRSTVTYEEDAYYLAAIKYLMNDKTTPGAKYYKRWLPYSEYYYGTDKAMLHMVQWPHKDRGIDSKKATNFVRNVNPTVEAKFNAIYDAMIEKFNKLYELHPALKWLERNNLGGCTDDILIDLGEMEK